tara:strand:+ start:114 stop:503 length:390 start_codon:yes stop_codon:yes gene_type:complete
MNEKLTLEYINNEYNLNAYLVKDEFSSYDAECKDYIIEIKNRRKYYKDKLIEANKLFANYNKAQIKNKDFLYLVTDDKGVYVFNISKNIKEIISQDLIPKDCPATTDFNNNRKIIKYNYLLNENLCKKI